MNNESELLKHIVSAIVDHPDDIRIDRSVDDRGVLLKLTVHDSDIGRVVGKKGSTAEAIRAILHALGQRNNARYSLKIEAGDGK